MDGGRQYESGVPPEADIVATIEHALLAVRRDQSRRRPPWADGMPHGHGHHGGYWGAGPSGGDRSADDDRTAGGHRPPGGHPAPGDHRASGDGPTPGGHPAPGDHRASGDGSSSGDGSASGAHPASGGGPFGGPWSPPGAPFGDSARPGPGRRGRDGSLGRIARIRMLEALQAADAEGRNLSVSGVAAAIGVDQPRASRLVQEGVERGLVRRVPDPSDARRALIQLTTAGRAQLEEVRTHRRSAVETALASFTPEEARTFAELFDRFVRAWPRPD